MFNTAQELAADIARELREHPERWTTGSAARDSAGNPTASVDPRAVCWCLFGHIVKRRDERAGFIPNDLLEPFFAAAGLSWDVDGFDEINDNGTVSDIIAICDKVAALNS